MNTFESAALVVSVVAVGAPMAFFHGAIARELGRLRDHLGRGNAHQERHRDRAHHLNGAPR
jgi:hypothetical protein